MIESKPSFFETQIKGTLVQAAELGHTSFGITPETLDTVDVTFVRGELISSVVDSEIFVETDINQAITTRPSVRMNERRRINVIPDNSLQCSLGAVRHDFCLDHALSFERPEHNRLSMGTSSKATTHSVGSKVGLIDFNRIVQRRSLLTVSSQSLGNLQVDRIHSAKRDTRHFGSHCCCQIHHTGYKLAEFDFADSRTAVAPVFSNHFGKLS